MSIDSRSADWDSTPPLVLEALGFPPPTHALEAALFIRQEAMSGHDQAALEAAFVVVVGCGGLGSWMAITLARMGVRRLALIDPDRYDRSNAPRQLVTPEDIGRPKAHALARHVAGHMLNPGRVIGLAAGFREASEDLPEVPTALLVGVDNNDARLAVSSYAVRQRIPAGFCMLSQDGLRLQSFLQQPQGPCLACVLPDADPIRAAPCAAAAMPLCLIAGAHTVSMLTRCLMGAADDTTWRESSLDGSREQIGSPTLRRSCFTCGAYRT